MLYRRTLWILLPFFVWASVDSGTVLLLNDSPFILTATIQASNGTYLGEMTLQPNQQQNFTTNLSPTDYVHPGRPQVSLTPYIVIWQCPSKDFYSMCTRVSPGAMVRANDCQGLRYCGPKPEPRKPASKLKKSPED